METPSPVASTQPPSAECAFQCAGSAAGGLPLAEIDIPDSLRGDLALFLRLERKVLDEYDPEIRSPVSYTHLTQGMGQSVPCETLCPAHVNVPGYIALVGEGRYADAIKLIRKDNPFPTALSLIHI